jgi:hypothetical protein
MPFDPVAASNVTFLPLADPQRRAADPIRALEAAHDLQLLLSLGSLGAATAARGQGRTWAEIGLALGITKQAAQQRFGLLTDLATSAVVVGHDQATTEPRKPGRQQPKRRRKR